MNTGAADGLALRKRGSDGRSRRQIGQRGVDRGLHVARGAVDVAADRELQLDAGRAERTGRGDLVTPAISPSRRSSGAATVAAIIAGIGAGPARRDADGREVDIRQARDRQEVIGDDADQQQPDRQQRGADRPADEGVGEFMTPSAAAPATAPAAAAPAARARGCSRSIAR